MSGMRYNGLAPNRAADVLHFLRVVDATGDPSPQLVAETKAAMAKLRAGERANPAASLRFEPLTYENIARRLGWHRGGPGDHLAKAIALCEVSAQPVARRVA